MGRRPLCLHPSRLCSFLSMPSVPIDRTPVSGASLSCHRCLRGLVSDSIARPGAIFRQSLYLSSSCILCFRALTVSGNCGCQGRLIRASSSCPYVGSHLLDLEALHFFKVFPGDLLSDAFFFTISECDACFFLFFFHLRIHLPIVLLFLLVCLTGFWSMPGRNRF